jgi:hypothetical protein
MAAAFLPPDGCKALGSLDTRDGVFVSVKVGAGRRLAGGSIDDLLRRLLLMRPLAVPPAAWRGLATA